MKKIMNVSPYGDLDVPLLGVVVVAGEVVDVDDDHAAVLLDQAENFVLVESPTEPPAEPVTPESEQS